jgi:hypothetical protein
MNWAGTTGEFCFALYAQEDAVPDSDMSRVAGEEELSFGVVPPDNLERLLACGTSRDRMLAC